MTELPLDQRFADAMGQLLGPDFPSDIGLAVSGGGDSMAMLYLAHNWTKTYGVRLWVVTVDHGLRPESADEAAMVAQECAVLGWSHTILRWQWDGHGNVQDAARRARLSLIDRWRGAVGHVLFAHTEDDQAETVLMRLARGSGVDGLAGMRASRFVAHPPFKARELSNYDGNIPPVAEPTAGFRAVRPCLEMSREALRHYARTLKGHWVEDPSNEDRSFDRVRVRQMLKLLGQERITPSVLAGTARRMARAQDGLKARLCDAVIQVCLDAPLGHVRIERDGFAVLDTETQMRLLTAALCYVAAAEYRPRAVASEALLERVLSGGGGTLHGAEVLVEASHLRVIREMASVQSAQARPGDPWDKQWVLADEKSISGCIIRALGTEGWKQIDRRAELPLPYRAALPSPALWKDSQLISCPALGFGPALSLTRYVLGRRDSGFEAFCLSH